MAYIRRAAAPPEGGCLFCRVAASGADRGHLVLARRPHALLMLNRYPYNPAHLMVAIHRHVARFADLSGAEREDWMALTALAERALTAEYHPDGMNLGVNLGRVAGAGFPGHLHQHLVPRWNGDTNFMPTLAETRVLPESLGRTWSRLRRAIEGFETGRKRVVARAGTPSRRRTRPGR
jgi:ATP adenylyltransferase